MNKTIVITGATGFIGGALCVDFKQRGYNVIGLDLVRKRYLEVYMGRFYHCDVEELSSKDIEWKDVDSIIHCAGTSLVNPSFKTPLVYYYNNVCKTADMLSILKEHPHIHLLFSSSASVYKSKDTLLNEQDPLEPISPYAKSKHMIEQIITDFVKAYNIKATIFRYFNACGSMGELHGQEPGSTHIFPMLMENGSFDLYGTDYKTKDGTCIRDYIHVADITDAHVKAIEKSVMGIYNLGNGIGYSNNEIIEEVVKTTGSKNINICNRREGDADILVANPEAAKSMLGWVPLNTLKDTVSDLNKWYNSDTFKTFYNSSK